MEKQEIQEHLKASEKIYTELPFSFYIPDSDVEELFAELEEGAVGK